LPLLSGASPGWSGSSSAPFNAAPNPTDAGALQGLEGLARQHEKWRRRLIRIRTELALTDDAQNLPALIGGPFAQAIRRESIRRMDRFLTGVQTYRHHPARRDFAEPAVIAEDGAARLLDFAPFAEGAESSDVALLMVPSLVNRWQVLDISPERSLMRALARGGVRALLVDWGTPVGPELGFSATDCVLRLERLMDRAQALGFARLHVGGYCMGGNLALALALRRQSDTASLMLLATPWDFHADRTGQALMMANLPFLGRLVDVAGELSVDALQTLFYSLDPWLVIRKFMRFAQLDPASAEAREFVLLEDWLNDGAPVPGPMALDCLLGWYGANTPGRGEWSIGGEVVEPRRLAVPSLVVVPGQDRIVPPASARALADPAIGIPNARRIDLALGHIGMMVSGRAPQLLWQPLLQWLHGGAT
jgi:polyhydroxyalkanoate synthase